MGLGNGNPKEGDKGSNFNYELKVLQGLQCACDQLKAINIDTDDLEQLLADLIAELQAGIDVTVVNGAGASAVNIQDGGNSITVDGSVSVTNGAGASAVNIQDGGNSITVDGTVAVSSLPAVSILSLPNEGQQTMANSISVALASNQAGVQRTPTFLRPANTSGTISAGTYSMSFANVGTINATVGGITLKPGETISFDAGAVNNTLGSVAYNATGAGGELLIISIT